MTSLESPVAGSTEELTATDTAASPVKICLCLLHSDIVIVTLYFFGHFPLLICILYFLLSLVVNIGTDSVMKKTARGEIYSIRSAQSFCDNF